MRVMMADKGVRNTITFPSEVYEEIKRLAEDENRSISQQVIYLCRTAIQQLKDKK